MTQTPQKDENEKGAIDSVHERRTFGVREARGLAAEGRKILKHIGCDGLCVLSITSITARAHARAGRAHPLQEL